MTAKPETEAMEDEPIWGHFHRFVRVHGFRDIQTLEAAFPSWKYSGAARYIRLRSAIVKYLAGGREKRTLYNYFQAHSQYPQVFLPEIWLARWRYMLNRWSFHVADFYRSPLTIRSCPICAMEDVRAVGFAWFRRSHQLPGVDWCLSHLCPLHVQPAKLDFLRHFNWRGGQVPVRLAVQGKIPPLIHRYIHAITWLARSSGCPDNAYQLMTAATSIDYGENMTRAGELRLCVAAR